jgi:hypothetical protein
MLSNITPAPYVNTVTSISLNQTETEEEPSATSKENSPFIPKTLVKMKQYNYIDNSVTGLSNSLLPLKNLKDFVKKFGTLYGRGMSFYEYKKAMSYEWSDCTEYNKKPVRITVDITKSMNYKSYVEILKKLSRYRGVYLYQIGQSTEDRNLYAIEIDIPSKKKKDVLMFTGQVHAREFAGGTFLVKMLVDLVQKAQSDKQTMELLMNYKYVVVPIINVDGREALIKNTKKWTTSTGMWKAYTNGTDGNRNFPGLLWGQLTQGNDLKRSIKFKPGSENYAGKYAGSNNETKALMKWIYHYTIVEKALCLVDMHQQGALVYAGKGWTTKEQSNVSIKLRKKVLEFLNKGNTKRKYGVDYDEPVYGFEGGFSTITDYAISISCGAKFSPAMGCCAFTDGKKEFMLLEIVDLDEKKIKVNAPNKSFATLTMEIGKGSKYLGNSTSTRKLIAEEYINYHFNSFMEKLPEMLD